MMELGRGKYALAISDGMGNGERAHEESMETLRLSEANLAIWYSRVCSHSVNQFDSFIKNE